MRRMAIREQHTMHLPLPGTSTALAFWIFPDSVCWRWPDGEFIAGINLGAASEEDYPMVVLPLDRLIKLFYDHLVKLPNAKVFFGHRVIRIDQDDKEARTVVETDEGQKTMAADYIVGADGASSKIRRCLLGDEYPGETLPQQIIATNVSIAFPSPNYHHPLRQ